MKSVEFYEKYQSIANQISQYTSTVSTLNTAQRAEGTIKNQQDMNELFGDKVYDSLMGTKIDIMA